MSTKINLPAETLCEWIEKHKSVVMVVASVIATMAYQIAVNPPKPYNPNIDLDPTFPIRSFHFTLPLQ